MGLKVPDFDMLNDAETLLAYDNGAALAAQNDEILRQLAAMDTAHTNNITTLDTAHTNNISILITCMEKFATIMHTFIDRTDTFVATLETLSTNVATLRANSDAFQLRADAANFNTTVRMANYQNTKYGNGIIPLRNPATNLPIPNFPARDSHVYSMSEDSLNRILEALEDSTDGDMEDKKLRIRGHIGIRRPQ